MTGPDNVGHGPPASKPCSPFTNTSRSIKFHAQRLFGATVLASVSSAIGLGMGDKRHSSALRPYRLLVRNKLLPFTKTEP